MLRHYLRVLVLLVSLLLASVTAYGQSTAFTYQGKLSDTGNPANGQYDFQFKLFDTQTVGTGTEQGSMVAVSDVTVAAGIFTVQLDFGACASCFDGSARFLEIAVKPSSGGAFTTLSPRQPITPAPYAIKSQAAATADGLSLACTNCVTSNQILSLQGSKVTGNIAGSQISGTIPVASVPSGSSLYVQNQNASAQSANFNISGNGTIGGNVGIGTTAPNKHLHVAGAGDQEIMIESTDTGGIKWTLQSSRGLNNGRFEIIDRTAGASRFSVLDSGNVGIGTTAPENRLHVAGAIQSTGARSSAPAANAVTLSSESTFDALQSWANRPLVLNGLGNNVGIGTTAPATRLDVNGDVRVNGDIIIPSQTRHLSIPGAGFTPTGHAGYLISVGGIAIANAGSLFDPMTAAAMVNLPDGAVVTRVRANVVDGDGGSGQNIRVRLERKGLNGDSGVPDVMADVSSSGTGTNIVLSDTSISDATIDNGNFSYYIRVTSPGGSDFTWYLYSVIIDYTVTTPLP